MDTSETLSITAVPGGQLTLECPVDAVPPPYIEWHREGSPLRVGVPGGLRGWVPPPLSPIVLPVGTAADRGCPGGSQGDAHRQILAEGRFLRIWDVGAADGGEYVCRAGTATGDSRQSFQVEIHGEHRPAARLGRGRAHSLSIPFIGDRDAQYFGVSYGWGNRKRGVGWV